MKQPASEALAALVGLDWAETKPDVCLQAAGTAPRELLSLEHSPAEMPAWGQTLRTRCNGPPVAGCLELKKGPIVSALRADDARVLFPVQPFTGAKYRQAFTPSRAKDAPTDAALQVASRLTPRDTRTPLSPQSPTRRALAQLVAHRRRLGGDTVRLPNRLTRALKNDVPQGRQGLQEQAPVLFGDFLSPWPTLKAVQRARRTTVAGCCRAHHGRSADVSAPHIEAIKSARALTTEDGGIAPNVLLVHALVAQLRGTWPAMADFDNAIAQRAQDHPAFPWFDALPGAGTVLAPRLLVACGAHRERCPAAADLQKYAGMVPGTERRGKQAWGHWRRQWPTCLRQTVVEWAAESTRHTF